MMIISILEPLPTHVVTSPSTNLCLFCNSCFGLLIFSNRTSIKYPGATINTSKAHINNLYIKYTLCSLCHLSYPPNIQGISASSDHSLCNRSTQFQAWVQLWAFFMGVATCFPFFLRFPLFPCPFS